MRTKHRIKHAPRLARLGAIQRPRERKQDLDEFGFEVRVLDVVGVGQHGEGEGEEDVAGVRFECWGFVSL